MWLKDWRTTVNGIAVPPQASPEGLVMVPVRAGPNTVTLDYVPPFSVRASFYLFLASWLLAGAAAAGWLLKIRLPRRSHVTAFLAPFWRHWLTLTAAVIAAAVALWAIRTKTHPQFQPGAAGPIEVRFLLHNGQPGKGEPLVATGHSQAGVVVFITMLDGRHATVAADVWGTLYKSEPFEINISQLHTLVVSESALYPVNNLAVAALPAEEVDRLRHQLRVEMDGVVLIEAKCYAFEASPSEVFVGRAPFGSVSDSKFSGEFIDSRRLPIPRLVGMPWGARAALDIRFPLDRTGTTESLLAANTDMGTVSYSVTYVAANRLRISDSGPDGRVRQSGDIDTDMAKPHTMRFFPSEPTEPGEAFGMSCELDGRRVLGGEKPRVMAVYPLLSAGVDIFAAKDCQLRFSGPELDLSFTADGAAPCPPEEHGPVHMIVVLPKQRPGRHEPLLATGRTGAGDMVYVFYEDSHHIRIGFDHWGVGGTLSDPVEVDYAEPHEIWVLEGTLFPEPGDNAGWGATPNTERAALRSTVSVMLDGKTVLSGRYATFPTAKKEVVLGKNSIGASTADPEFGGIIRYSERTGTFVPPGLKP